MNKYKKISIKNKHFISPENISIIKELNLIFKKSELQIVPENDGLKILLREIDIERLRGLENIFLDKYKLTPSDNLISEITAAIEKIKSYGIKSGKRLYVDYNKERKVKNRVQKEEKRGQFYYARGHEFSETNTDVPTDYVNKIIRGDSELILHQLPDNCIDLVFTSPPYNFGLDYEKSDDDHFWENYFDKLFQIFDECVRVLKYGGRIIVNIQPLFSDYIPSHHLISNFFIQRKLIWKGEVLWEKNNYNCKYTAWGSWKSPSNPYLKYTWEFLEIFCKGDMKKSGERDNIDISADDFKKWVTAKWSISPERKMKQFGHPAMFPEELAKRILQLFSYKNDLILDPFNGAGTTTYVANALERRYLGIDISEEYCKTAKNRINEKLL